jgi:hypothetical protein
MLVTFRTNRPTELPYDQHRGPRRACGRLSAGRRVPLHPARVPLPPPGTPFTAAQAAEAGWTPGRLATAVRAGRLQRVHHGVFVAGGVPLTALLRARGLLLVLPDRFHVSHESAADLWGVDCRRPQGPGDPVDHPLRITAATRARVGVRPGISVVEGRLPAAHVASAHGVPVTTPARTAVDLACERSLPEAVVAVDAFLAARRTTPADVHARPRDLPRPPRHPDSRRVLELADGRAESPMESRLRVLLVLAGLPAPVPQHEVRDGRGRFLARGDLAYVAERIAIEYDGRESHLEPGRFLHDRHRHHDLREAGWEVLRFTADDVLRHPTGVVARVERALGQPSADSRDGGYRPDEEKCW